MPARSIGRRILLPAPPAQRNVGRADRLLADGCADAAVFSGIFVRRRRSEVAQNRARTGGSRERQVYRRAYHLACTQASSPTACLDSIPVTRILRRHRKTVQTCDKRWISGKIGKRLGKSGYAAIKMPWPETGRCVLRCPWTREEAGDAHQDQRRTRSRAGFGKLRSSSTDNAARTPPRFHPGP